MPARAMVIVVMERMPERMTGIANGSLMRTSVWSRVLPMPLAASNSSGSMFVMPVWVLRTIGNSA